MLRSFGGFSGSKVDCPGRLIATVFYVYLVWQVAGYDIAENVYIPIDGLKVNGKTVFTLVTAKLTWNEAVDACKKKFDGQAGTIARPDSYEAMSIILDLISSASTPEDTWIGLYWHGKGGNLRMSWQDISCTDYHGEGYANFKHNEDNFDSTMPCYYVEQETGQWTRDACIARHYFVCQHLDFTDTSSCGYGGNQHTVYSEVKANFYKVDSNGVNANQCTRKCSDITGCFLTWPSDGACLMGVAESSGRAYVKSKCLAGQASADPGTYDSNSDSDPVVCQTIDTSSLSAGDAITNYATGSDCGSAVPATVTETTVNTTTVTSTETTVQATTHFNTATITITLVSTTTSPPETTTVLQQSCMDTVTTHSLQPATVTETILSIQPTTVVSFSSIDCISPSRLVSQCPDAQTVTMVTTNHVTSTVTECSHTSCATTALPVIHSDGGGGGSVVTTPVLMTSTVYITHTTTQTLHVTATLQPTNQTCQTNTPTSSTISPQKLEQLTSSIIQELTVETSQLSSTRRRKESAPDGRTTAKVSGFIAIFFICCAAVSIVTVDAPVFLGHLKLRLAEFKST